MIYNNRTTEKSQSHHRPLQLPRYLPLEEAIEQTGLPAELFESWIVAGKIQPLKAFWFDNGVYHPEKFQRAIIEQRDRGEICTGESQYLNVDELITFLKSWEATNG